MKVGKEGYRFSLRLLFTNKVMLHCITQQFVTIIGAHTCVFPSHKHQHRNIPPPDEKQ